MGNLPTSRTETCIPGAPVNANLLNEIQDAIVAHSRDAWIRSLWPPISSGAASVIEAANPGGGGLPPVRKINAAAAVYLELQYDQGDIINGLSLQGYGDGAVDVTVQAVYSSGEGVGQLTLSTTLTITNAVAAWTTYSLASFIPTLLASGPLSLIINTSAANFYFGRVVPLFSRL